MSATQTGDQPATRQAPGKTSNGQAANRTPRKSRAAGKKRAARVSAAPPPSAAAPAPIAPAKVAAPKRAVVRPITLASAANAARVIAQAPPLIMDAMLQCLPPSTTKWTADDAIVWLGAAAANLKLCYGIKEPITVSKAA